MPRPGCPGPRLPGIRPRDRVTRSHVGKVAIGRAGRFISQGHGKAGKKDTQAPMRGHWLSLLAALSLAVLPGTAVAQSLVRDAEIERTLGMVMAPVYRGGATDPASVQILLIGDRSLNAFVAGGRNIFVHTGLLTRLETPGELQAVLAHELGHINGGHLARRGIEAQGATGSMALGLLLAIAAGVAGSPDAAAAALIGSSSVVQRSFLSFSRGEEASADQAALTYMERGGIDPSGMIDVLEIFRGQENLGAGRIDPYAQTHPMSVDRILLAERRIRASANLGDAPDPELAYWYERMRAKLDGFLGRPEQVLTRLPKGPPSEATLVRKAVALHRMPDPDAAVATMEELIAKRPKDPFYQELMAQILLESGRVGDAVPYYRRAAAAAPGEPLIAASLARALLALDGPAANAEALALLDRSTRADPRNSTALRDLATAQARAGHEGLAALATAERFAIEARFRDSTRHARRAVALLPEGSPGWLKAQDIVLVGERILKSEE